MTVSCAIDTPLRQQLARELLSSAPVLEGNRTVANFLEKPAVDFQRLVDLGFWSTGERLVIEAAAIMHGEPIVGLPSVVDWEELRARLDNGNFSAVANVFAMLR